MSRVEGGDELAKNLQDTAKLIDQSVREAVYATAQEARGHAIKAIQTQSVGQEYGNHVASAPGDAPNTDSGTLVRSLALNPNRPATSINVGTDTEYAVHLEFGTRNMAARPFLTPAYEHARGLINAEIEKAIKRNLAGSLS